MSGYMMQPCDYSSAPPEDGYRVIQDMKRNAEMAQRIIHGTGPAGLVLRVSGIPNLREQRKESA